MNEITLKPAAPVIESTVHADRFSRHSRSGESLLERVLSALIKSLKDYRIPRAPAAARRGYIEENLLDPNVGPEIHRALR